MNRSAYLWEHLEWIICGIISEGGHYETSSFYSGPSSLSYSLTGQPNMSLFPQLGKQHSPALAHQHASISTLYLCIVYRKPKGWVKGLPQTRVCLGVQQTPFFSCHRACLQDSRKKSNSRDWRRFSPFSMGLESRLHKREPENEQSFTKQAIKLLTE